MRAKSFFWGTAFCIAVLMALGQRDATAGVLTGYLWLDNGPGTDAGNGLKDASEGWSSSLTGVRVALYANGQYIQDTVSGNRYVTPDASGIWSFSSTFLQDIGTPSAINWRLLFELPSGTVITAFTTPNVGSNEALDSDAIAQWPNVVTGSADRTFWYTDLFKYRDGSSGNGVNNSGVFGAGYLAPVPEPVNIALVTFGLLFLGNFALRQFRGIPVIAN
jgi:hypothetical protein